MTLNKLRLQANEKGFTLIELMIVIAIIGILAAIAIPNFISYRDKSFCSAAESDANAIAAGISDYFAIPTNVTWTTQTNVNPVVFAGGTDLKLTKLNTATVSMGGTPSVVTIVVKDGSSRCPVSYQTAVGNPPWSGALGGTYTKTM
ncbi:MAG: prepilin-type N-terminal cleavage/methylation domain-containing protein [Desulfobulbus sp.]|nr:prepilin-type N-terminal cleavage/methylation domain-containing protein [Desulfobulbus sp.]